MSALPYSSSLEWYYATGSSWRISINCLPMIDIDPTNALCKNSTLHFAADQTKTYGVTPVLTFDQPLWMKAQHIVDAESSTSRMKKIVLRLGNYTWQ